MSKFDPFVIPFTIGLAYILGFYFYQIAVWVKSLTAIEKASLKALLFKSPKKLIASLGEIGKECLLHINLFKTNKLLGFMHMSLAFGWFMLIVVGNLESKVYTATHINPPYFPIFLEFFLPNLSTFQLHNEFAFVMDLFLLLVLTGVGLAVVKRFTSKHFSIKQKPKLTLVDKVGLASLWTIFPLRLMAESLNAGIHKTGGFMTQPLGDALYSIGLAESSSYTAWWAYSISLGIFFISMPHTRYMHIMVEPFLIIVRNAGINGELSPDVFNAIQANSCSKCGVCLNSCPLVSISVSSQTQPIYLFDALRKQTLSPEMVESCLNCRRCEQSCPVGLTLEPLRLKLKETAELKPDYSYTELAEYPTAKVGYYSGCMGKLTPATTKAIQKIGSIVGDEVIHIDKESGICCGRPQKLAGQLQCSEELMLQNIKLFEKSGIKTLITSCPICLKTFRDDYKLSIKVVHHTEYIANLVNDFRLEITNGKEATTYHDPCELTRGCNITEEPRMLLRMASSFEEMPPQTRAQCCGNSLAHSNLSEQQKQQLASITLDTMPQSATHLITSCPACSRAFKKDSSIATEDIAVLVAKNARKPKPVNERTAVGKSIKYTSSS